MRGDIIMINEKNRKKLRKTSGNWGRFVAIFIKFFKTNSREKAVYFWVFGYPLIFMVMIGLGVSETATTYHVAIINYDVQPFGTQTNNDVIEVYPRPGGFNESVTIANLTNLTIRAVDWMSNNFILKLIVFHIKSTQLAIKGNVVRYIQI